MFIARDFLKSTSLRRSDMLMAPRLSKRLFAPEERHVYSTRFPEVDLAP